MRNLKKFLALVLAMMMTLSLMITVNAASDFTDVDTITDEFSEAVAVLEGLKVFEGYPDKTFKPKNNITRAEVATIVYRLATGDVKGNQAHLYKDYATFSDVKSDHWAAGYINYCANAEWIAGYGNGKFGPGDSVTGYQAAAMILRAVGYGKNGEFTGSGWQVQVANVTRSQGLLVNVDDTTYANTLNQAATRELIAEILFQAGNISTVNWTMLLGYQNSGNGSLGWQNFKLLVGGWDVVDEWGNPGYYWYKGTNTAANRVATIMAEPDMEFTDTKHECDIAHELDFAASQPFDLYLNGKTAVTSNYLVVATDTTTKVGGQGRLTKVYDTLEHPWDGREYPNGSVDNNGRSYVYNLADKKATVTMVDTFLARVTQVAEARLDAAGHVITPATLTLAVYDQPQATAKTPNPSTSVLSKKSTDATNWEYSAGDMILLNAWTDRANGIDDVTGLTSSHAATATEPQKNKAAFEAEQVPATLVEGGATANLGSVVGVAKSRVAKQTTVYWNQGKHNVDGTDIPDQLDLFLDVAGTTTNSDYTWYFDQYDNIIGIGEAVKSNFGVITSLYSSFNTADGATNGESVAKAHVKYADGSEGDVIIAQFVVNTESIGGGHAAGGTVAMVGTTGSADGAFELKPVYDFSTNAVDGDTMEAMTMVGSYTPVNPVEGVGQLNVSPVASINATAEGNVNTNPYYGIIKDNLFKFVTAGDGKVSAIEVAGLSTNDTVYVNNYNGTFATDANANAPTNAEIAARTLYKNGGYLSVNTPATTIRLDNNTQIMVKSNDSSETITTYNGLSALPGNIICVSGSEVDWADYDGDGIAEVVYVTGENAGSTAYGLFYYAGGAGQWNDTDKKGTLAGYLGGEAKTLTFTNRAEYDLVRGSNAYGGHLFGVRLNGDEVTNLMGRNVTNDKDKILSDGATLGTFTPNTTALTVGTDVLVNSSISSTGVLTLGATTFVTGVTGGNGYTGNTKAIWLADPGTGATNVLWDQYTNQIYVDADSSGTITAGDTTYALTGASKIVGDLAYLNRTDRTNDVTIVYEDNAVKSIVEVYVTTMPDNTPGGISYSFSSDVTQLNGGNFASDTALGNYLKTLGNNTVAYCPTLTPDKATMLVPDSDAPEQLYFGWNGVASLGATDTLTLAIRDSAGRLVYNHTIGHTAAVNPIGHYTMINFVDRTKDSDLITPMGAGVYTYSIFVTGTPANVISSGSFTIG